MVRMYGHGVFNVWYACPYCGYRSWARAYGVGEGFDTGIQNTASAAVAQQQANVMAEHAASRAVLGSPCPRCGQHHPDVVRWAASADARERRRVTAKRTARTLRWVAIGAGVACVLAAAARMLGEAIVLGLLAATFEVVQRVTVAGAAPVQHRWVLYPRTAPGVTFLTGPDDPAPDAPEGA